MKRKSLIIAASAMVLALVTPALAENILTVSSEEATTWVRNFNPFSQSTQRATTPDFIYEPLVIFNRLKGNEPNFRLAESFQLADDLKSITFTLRDDLKWSDGQPLTADDVIFTYDYIKKFPALDFISVWGLLDSVDKVDDRTVKFTLKQPNSLIANTLVGMPIVPQHIWKDVADPVTFANETPVGSGPMTEIRRFTPQVYEQCRNPNYWDAKDLAVDCLRLPQIAGNDQALAALADGTLDWATSFIPDIDNTFVAKDPEHNHYWFPPSSLVSYQVSMITPDENNRKAFNDVNFRRALSMLVDRKTIVDIAEFGYAPVNEDPSMLGQLYKAFANPDVATKYGQYGKFDFDAGVALLEKSGYVDKDGDGFRDNPDGTPIAIDIEVPNGWTDWIDAVQITMESLKKAGLNVKMSNPEASVWAADLTAGKFSMTLNALGSAADPYLPYRRSFNPDDFGKSRFAAPHWQSDDVMKLLNQYTQEKDSAARKATMDQLQMLVADAMPMIPVYNSAAFYEYSTKRFTGWANADNPVFSPVVSNANPGRVLQLLALKPVAQ